MKGYYKNDEATKKAMEKGWFHSGDLAVVHKNGYIQVKDRSKDIIISGGENISSVEIENTLTKHPSVSLSAVVARPDKKWGETPCAFVELIKGKIATEDELLKFCRETLAGFKMPKKIIFCELPKTSTGKIQKYELRKKAKGNKLNFEIDDKSVFSMDTGEISDSKKNTIFLLHGSGQSHVVWSLTTQFLSDQNNNVFAIDFPGHGNSEGESLKSIEDMAEWLDKVVKKLDLNEITLIGHSQGCLVALEYASKFTKKVKNIIFAGSYEIPVNKDLINLALAGDMETLNLMMKWGYGSSKQFIGGNPLQKILNSAREVRDVLATDLIACNNYKNGTNAIKKINCPTFFIFGELDKMIRIEKGKEFANLFSNSKTHIIKNCGHMILLENAFEMREKDK